MPDQAERTGGTDTAGAAPAPVPAVRVEGLWKRFGEQVAVAGIDLELPAGKFIGLVGPNGAGKTTTLSMVTGLLRPDMGRIEVAGHDVWRDPVEVKSRIGVLPEGLRLFERLSGRELLGYTGRLRGLPGAEVDKRATQLLDVLDLAGAQHKLVVDYSTGMRKKIGLASALLHNPEVLFLDEPFEGVDPVSAQTIRGVLERYTRSGATVVFSSHVMELVESLCDWVAVLAAGRIRAHGTLTEVRGDAASSRTPSWNSSARAPGTPGSPSTGWAVPDDGAGRPAGAAVPAVRGQGTVPVFARLKLTLLRNGLRQSSGRRAAYVASLVVTLLLAAGRVIALVALRGHAQAGTLVVLLTAVLALGWAVMPLFFPSGDETLDPSRLVMLPLRRGR